MVERVALLQSSLHDVESRFQADVVEFQEGSGFSNIVIANKVVGPAGGKGLLPGPHPLLGLLVAVISLISFMVGGPEPEHLVYLRALLEGSHEAQLVIVEAVGLG